MTDILCPDANVYIKFLVNEDPPELTVAARRLMGRALSPSVTLVAPAFTWAEVASALRKKVRIGEVSQGRAMVHWDEFLALPITFQDTGRLRARAWEIADEYNLPTLYDAAYLACTELMDVDDPGSREFWTADSRLLTQLGQAPPAYVHELK